MSRSRAHSFAPRTVDRSKLNEVLRNPRSRAESVLDGLFSECAVCCEADGDRVVYEAAYSQLPIEPKKSAVDETVRVTRDLRFIPVSGLSANTALLHVYRALGIPAAAVVDTDILTNKRELGAIAGACGADAAELASLDKLSAEVIVALRAAIPEVTVEDFKARLLTLAEKDYDWAAGDDDALRDQLASLKNSLARSKTIKKGIEVLEEPLRSTARATLARLEKIGLFILPVGTLESWIPDLMTEFNRSNKPEWATAAAEKLRQTPARPGQDIWAFVARIDRFARTRSEELARTSLSSSTPTVVSPANPADTIGAL